MVQYIAASLQREPMLTTPIESKMIITANNMEYGVIRKGLTRPAKGDLVRSVEFRVALEAPSLSWSQIGFDFR